MKHCHERMTVKALPGSPLEVVGASPFSCSWACSHTHRALMVAAKRISVPASAPPARLAKVRLQSTANLFLVSDTLDHSSEHLAIGWRELALHDGHDCQPGKLCTACRISQPPKAHTGTRSTRRRPHTSTIVRTAIAPNTRLTTSSSFVMGMPSQCGHSPFGVSEVTYRQQSRAWLCRSQPGLGRSCERRHT